MAAIRTHKVLTPRTYVEYSLPDGVKTEPLRVRERDVTHALRSAPGMWRKEGVGFTFFDTFEIKGQDIDPESRTRLNESKPFYVVDGKLIIGNLKGNLAEGVTQQTYVEFRAQGMRSREMESIPIDTRDLVEIMTMMPPNMVGFRVFDRLEIGKRKSVRRSYRFNRTGYFYPDGKIMTVADVERESPEAERLIEKIKSGKEPRRVRTRRIGIERRQHSFYENDFVLSTRVLSSLLRD